MPAHLGPAHRYLRETKTWTPKASLRVRGGFETCNRAHCKDGEAERPRFSRLSPSMTAQVLVPSLRKAGSSFRKQLLNHPQNHGSSVVFRFGFPKFTCLEQSRSNPAFLIQGSILCTENIFVCVPAEVPTHAATLKRETTQGEFPGGTSLRETGVG